MWRVGLMGPNARIETADRVFEALTAVVESQGVAVAG
jgi:aspartate aminotransferase-like enzyme